MVLIPQISEQRKERYTQKDRDERDASYRREMPSNRRIDPLHDAESRCPQKQWGGQTPIKSLQV